jgi:muconate cycloisomerase
MKIKHLYINEIAAPLKNPLVTAQSRRTSSNNIILQIEFDNGLWGCGESIPRTYVTGESPETVFEVINQQFFPVLKTAHYEKLSDIEEVTVELNKYLQSNQGIFHGSALCAVELALLDGLGKLLGKPLQFILGTPLRKKLEYSLGFPYVDDVDLSVYYQLISKYQPKNFKIKVGRSPSKDLERVAKIQSYFGGKVELRIDANCQWDLPTAMRMAKELEKLGVTAIEQPLAKNDIEGFRELKKSTSLNILADESACSFDEIEKLIDVNACDSVVIKISKNGGILNSLKIADYLYHSNKQTILGAHVAETGILESAGRVFGVLAQSVQYFEGSISPFLFREPVVKGIMAFDRQCQASPLQKPGLGIEVVKEIVSKYTVRSSRK